MKKYKFSNLILLFSILFIFILSSCSIINNNENEDNNTINYTNDSTDSFQIPESNNPNGYKIIYDCNNDNIYESTSTKDDKALNPGVPTKPCAKFLGWYSDSDCTKLYDFNSKVRSELTLYSGWDINIEELTTKIYQTTIKSNIKITSQPHTRFTKSTTINQGSGVIFFEDDIKYYILTNNHVVYYNTSEYIGSSYIVTDCYGNQYEASLINMNANYDLAILSIRKELTPKSLGVSKICTHDIKVNDKCISISTPDGLINSISFGKVTGYNLFKPETETLELNNINFNIIVNSAYIESGSSGGALIDSNLKVAGIQFASASDYNNEYLRSFAVPASKITEYIKTVFN